MVALLEKYVEFAEGLSYVGLVESVEEFVEALKRGT